MLHSVVCDANDVVHVNHALRRESTVSCKLFHVVCDAVPFRAHVQ